MNSQKIILLKNSDYNKKIQWLKDFIDKNPDYIIIDQFKIRTFFDNPINNKNFEDDLTSLEKRIGIILLNLGKSIIINTIHNKNVTTYWSLVALTRDIDFEEIEFD